ncbi:Hypothetical protein, putative [Bodo saltans]|uniref:Uncharacterized protein n=1 Tax=Bodo saltans TaxID=75058 RepID=A0A0S4J6D8_BODSA|nr:Hypothetical protein, putative [Bodo saltans]|eukprot:CUG84810.1 Hypothetical protein, putative [Bodo saltans]
MYRHNPYPAPSTVLSNKITFVDENRSDEPQQPSGLSDCESRCVTPSHELQLEEEGMGCRNTSQFYDALSPLVPFYEYQEVRLNMMPRERAERLGLVRLFVGQVPYHLEAAHVAWMLELLSGCRVPLVEKIVRWTQNRKPCGCFHVLVRPRDVGAFMLLDQTVLCEAEVMWAARDASEKAVLEEHCRYLLTNPGARTPLMPYQLMTVQLASSDYGRGRGAAAQRW